MGTGAANVTLHSLGENGDWQAALDPCQEAWRPPRKQDPAREIGHHERGRAQFTCWPVLVRERGPESQRPSEITQTQAMRTVHVPSPRGATLSVTRRTLCITLFRIGGQLGCALEGLEANAPSWRYSPQIPGNQVAAHPERDSECSV